MPARRGDPPLQLPSRQNQRPMPPAGECQHQEQCRRAAKKSSGKDNSPSRCARRTRRQWSQWSGRVVVHLAGPALAVGQVCGRGSAASANAEIDIEGKRLGWSRRVRRGHARELRKLLKLYFAAVNKSSGLFSTSACLRCGTSCICRCSQSWCLRLSCTWLPFISTDRDAVQPHGILILLGVLLLSATLSMMARAQGIFEKLVMPGPLIGACGFGENLQELS